MTRGGNRAIAPASVAAVLFDYDHTLAVDNRLEQRVLTAIVERHCGVAPDDRLVAGALASFRSGATSMRDMLSAFHGSAFDADQVVAEYKAEALRRLPACLQPFPGATEVPKALRGDGLIVAILSNGWTELQRAKAAAIGFDGPVFVSEEIGAWKPDARAFAIAASRLGVDLSRALYVGDSPETDVAGSHKAGMMSVWARLEGQPYPDGVVRPDATIERLADVVGLCGVRAS